MSHTPGPWKIANGGRYQAQFRAICPTGDWDDEIDTQREICRLWSRKKNTLAEMEANAVLIAAAPDMLLALKQIEEACRLKANENGDGQLMALANYAKLIAEVAAPEISSDSDHGKT